MPIKNVVLERLVGQKTADKTIQKQVDYIVARSTSAGRGRSWTVKTKMLKPKLVGSNWLFSAEISFTKSSENKADSQWAEILSVLQKSGKSSAFGKYPWSVKGDDSEGFSDEEETKTLPVIKDTKDYAEINIDRANHFDHIYDRKNQIDIVHSAIVAAKESELLNRFHCVLFGPPGCGKSEILLGVGKMVGKENDAFMKFDATSTTEAGAFKVLNESDHIPPILLVEEIEKAEEKSLRWLLGLLDQRAEIRRTNFRVGNRSRNVKMLCLATVNDINLFRNVMSGALASRFAHQIHCPRPNRGLLQKILEREVAKSKGDPNWIEPTLKFCCDDNDMHSIFKDDPRKVVPICLCGREKLLTGEYQLSIKATQEPK